MKKQIMSSVVATLLLAGAGLASAAEPMALTDSQMDAVSAGAQFSWSTAGASAVIGLATAGTSTSAYSTYHVRVTRASGAALAVGLGASAGSSSGSAIF